MPRRNVPHVFDLAYFRAHFLEAIQEDGVVCLKCGGIYRALGTHVAKLHGLTLHQYKDQWGYNRKTSLIALDLRPRFRAMARAVNLPGYIRKTRAWVKGHAAIQQRGHRDYAKEFRLQRSASRHGQPIPGQQKVPDPVLADLRARGLTITQIARATGLARASIRERLRRLDNIRPGAL